MQTICAFVVKTKNSWRGAEKTKKAVTRRSKLERLCDRKTSLSKHLQSILLQLRLSNPFFSVRNLFPCDPLCKDDARLNAPSRHNVARDSKRLEIYAVFCCISRCHPPSGTRPLPQISSGSATCPAGTLITLQPDG